MSIHRDDPENTPPLQDEFWGEQAEWTARRRPTVERQRAGGTIARWWSGLLGGGIEAERTHGATRRAPTSESVSSSVDDADDDDLGVVGDAWTLEPEPEPRPNRTMGVDPLLARFGGLAIIITLAAPLIVGFTSSGSGSGEAHSVLATITSALPAEPATTSVLASDVPVNGVVEQASDPDSPAAVSSAQSGSSASSAPADAAAQDRAAIEPTTTETMRVEALALEAASEPAATAPVATAAPCGSEYELAAGDYWIRIADEAGVTLADLLDVNDSTVATVLVPGRNICLPVGAATPSPPETTSPPTTAPATTSTNRSTPTTTAPAPATTAPARPTAASASQSEAIIRDVWPDDLEEHALEIAWRESNYQSNVNNWCCYGLFQIHWNAHRSWLATIGVTSASQLYDPVVNANAAYTLYQRSGGFGPWGG